jgi:hypothetical protein
MFWILYIFFWVFPRRQIKFCRRFGTLCQFHLQRVNEEYEEWEVSVVNTTLSSHYSYSTVYINTTLSSPFIFFIQPLKMDLTEGSETSAKLNLTPGKYLKENIQDLQHVRRPYIIYPTYRRRNETCRRMFLVISIVKP